MRHSTHTTRRRSEQILSSQSKSLADLQVRIRLALLFLVVFTAGGFAAEDAYLLDQIVTTRLVSVLREMHCGGLC